MFLVNPIFINRESWGTKINLIVVGFISLLSQVVILRELNVAFFGIELIYVVALGVWLIGTTIGVSISKFRTEIFKNDIQTAFIIFSFALLIEIFFIRGVRILFGATTGAYLSFLYQLIGIAAAVLPVSILSGILFNWCARMFISQENTLAKAYAIESIGAVTGGLTSTIFILIGIQNFVIGLVCFMAANLIPIFYLSQKRHWYKIFASILLVISAGLFGISGLLDNWSTSWNHKSLITSCDTPYNRVTLTKNENQICVFTDDALAYETESIAAEEFVQLSTLSTDRCDQALILGGGFTGILDELLKLPFKNVDYVERDQEMLKQVKAFLSAESRRSFADPRVKIIIDDPRQYVKEKREYDAILVSMPEPMSIQSNRFYTLEFFKQCYNCLTQSGFVSFKILSSENLWTPQLSERNGSIYKALKAVFKNVVVLPGVSNIFIATKGTAEIIKEDFVDSFQKRGIVTKLVSVQYINYLFKNDRFHQIRSLMENSTTNVNTDLEPSCYGMTISIWLSKFFPSLSQLNISSFNIKNTLRSTWFYCVLFLIVTLFAVCKRRIRIRNILIVAVTGFAGMILEIILLVLYQIHNGVLFRDIGLLITLFMIGLSAGSIIINKYYVRLFSFYGLPKIVTITLTLMIIFTFIIYILLMNNIEMTLPLISLFLFVSGCFVSGIFSLISIEKKEDQQAQIISLYSADLLGGCLGSLLASLILLPFFGLISTLALLICLLFISLILFL
jgi:spermidine synthase